ncbi:MAG: alpha/beta hydrolase family protein [Nannocystales bacterium]
MRAAAHGVADELLTRAVGGPKLYSEGFGSLDELDALVETIRDYDASEPPSGIAMHWGERWTSSSARVRVGTFESPAASMLPPRTRRASVEFHEPLRGATGQVCLLLAATGEEGYTLRRRLVGDLLAEGIAALLLENPFYGSRRPQGQRFSLLRTVRDQFAMNTATVDEARALLGWIRDEGYVPGASGYSQGGMMTSFGAALCNFPVAAVPCASGLRAAPVFTENALQRRFDWGALADAFGSESAARRHFAECLEPVDVGRFPPPLHPAAAIVVGARYDGYIPEAEVEALHRHWPGSELRWVETGHLTGALLGKRAHLRAIVDAFGRMP